MQTRDIAVTATFVVRGPDDATIDQFVTAHSWLNPEAVRSYPCEVLPGTVFIDHMEDDDTPERPLEF